jgi:hypothetical protein
MEQHKVSSHSVQRIDDKDETDAGKTENNDLKRKLRILEENYDRLMNMFQKQQTESKDKALAFKIEVEAATESFRVAKAENEKLREVNETQHKLWKIFLDKFEKDENAKKKKNERESSAQSAADDDIEVVESEEEEHEEFDLENSYQEWLRDTRRRGFKRTSPASGSEKKAGNQEKPEERSGGKTSTRLDDRDNSEQVKYCHNWNNLGKCTFRNCRYVHQNAPVCKFDGECRREKCMFSHQKQNMHFLLQQPKPTQAQMNPWQSVIPPWSSPFAYQPNPWQGQNQRRQNQY